MKQIAYGVFAGVFLQVRRKMEGFCLGVSSDTRGGASDLESILPNRKEN